MGFKGRCDEFVGVMNGLRDAGKCYCVDNLTGVRLIHTYLHIYHIHTSISSVLVHSASGFRRHLKDRHYLGSVTPDANYVP